MYSNEASELLDILDSAKRNRQKNIPNVNILTMNEDLSDNTITKAHALSRGYYRFSLVEKRIMEALISKLNPLRLDNPQVLTLSAKEYSETYKIAKENAYRDLYSGITDLTRKVITIQKADAKKGIIEIPLMSIVDHKYQVGVIECEFNPKILPYLIALKAQFSSYPLKRAVNFSSSFTWRLYELLVSWSERKPSSKGKLSGKIDLLPVDELRKMLGVSEGYNYAKFESNVLNIAVEELKDKSNIIVNFERLKTSRKITHFNIEFKEV